MPKNYTLLATARADLHEITRYIAQDNPMAARKMKIAMMAACEKLGEHPHLGQERTDLTAQPVRFWPVHANYMIVYDAATSPVHILRIYNNARSVSHIFSE